MMLHDTPLRELGHRGRRQPIVRNHEFEVASQLSDSAVCDRSAAESVGAHALRPSLEPSPRLRGCAWDTKWGAPASSDAPSH